MKKYATWISLLVLPFLLFMIYTSMQVPKQSDKHLSSGPQIPDDIYVIIEISAQSTPVKYEMDKKTGLLFVDRFINTELRYPANYGYIPNTLSGDGDPTDVVVVTPYPVISGAVVRARPIALLKMTDEAGTDTKIIAVPIDKVYPDYSHIQSKDDLDPKLIHEIEYFFQNYKNAEPGKWVKTDGWDDADAAKKEILESIK